MLPVVSARTYHIEGDRERERAPSKIAQRKIPNFWGRVGKEAARGCFAQTIFISQAFYPPARCANPGFDKMIIFSSIRREGHTNTHTHTYPCAVVILYLLRQCFSPIYFFL